MNDYLEDLGTALDRAAVDWFAAPRLRRRWLRPLVAGTALAGVVALAIVVGGGGSAPTERPADVPAPVLAGPPAGAAGTEIAIADATGDPAFGDDVARALRDQGWTVGGVGEAQVVSGRGQPDSMILYGDPANAASAKAIGDALHLPSIQAENVRPDFQDVLPASGLAIVLGDDGGPVAGDPTTLLPDGRPATPAQQAEFGVPRQHAVAIPAPGPGDGEWLIGHDESTVCLIIPNRGGGCGSIAVFAARGSTFSAVPADPKAAARDGIKTSIQGILPPGFVRVRAYDEHGTTISEAPVEHQAYDLDVPTVQALAPKEAIRADGSTVPLVKR